MSKLVLPCFGFFSALLLLAPSAPAASNFVLNSSAQNRFAVDSGYDIPERPTPRLFSNIDLNGFFICFNHECSTMGAVSLDSFQWRTIANLFNRNRARDAEHERQLIGYAIQKFERISGEQTPTNKDRGKNYKTTLGNNGQMDCLDEASNVNTYLTILNEQGLLRFHQPNGTTFRHGFPAGHHTAVIVDLTTTTKWVVDAWWEHNGSLPYVLRLSNWQSGCDPQVARSCGENSRLSSLY